MTLDKESFEESPESLNSAHVSSSQELGDSSLAWFPYDRPNRPDRPSRFKIFRDDPDDWGDW